MAEDHDSKRAYIRQRDGAARNRLKAKRLASGLCGSCGQKPPSTGYKTCDACRTTAKARQQKGDYDHHKYYENKKRKGGCVACSKPAVVGRVFCGDCLREKRDRRGRRRVAGLCINCGKSPPPVGRRLCEACLAYSADTRQARDDAGRCRKCGKPPLPNKRQCAACLDRALLYRERLRDEVFEAYGGYTCVCCGCTTKEFLQLDHVHNDGAEHRRTIGTVSLHAWLKRNGFPPIIQVLCCNCNYAKANYGVCPHQLDKEVNHEPRKRRKLYQPLAVACLDWCI